MGVSKITYPQHKLLQFYYQQRAKFFVLLLLILLLLLGKFNSKMMGFTHFKYKFCSLF